MRTWRTAQVVFVLAGALGAGGALAGCRRAPDYGNTGRGTMSRPIPATPRRDLGAREGARPSEAPPPASGEVTSPSSGNENGTAGSEPATHIPPPVTNEPTRQP
jgi:hypothetical protein